MPHWTVRIATLGSYRGRGLASRLLSAAMERMKKEKGSFILWNCAGDNQASASLARKFGGEEVPCRDWDGWRSFVIAIDGKGA